MDHLVTKTASFTIWALAPARERLCCHREELGSTISLLLSSSGGWHKGLWEVYLPAMRNQVLAQTLGKARLPHLPWMSFITEQAKPLSRLIQGLSWILPTDSQTQWLSWSFLACLNFLWQSFSSKQQTDILIFEGNFWRLGKTSLFPKQFSVLPFKLEANITFTLLESKISLVQTNKPNNILRRLPWK